MTTRAETAGQNATPERGAPLIFVHSSLDDLGLSPEEFRVYAHLAGRRANVGGVAWPSAKSIAATCRIHRDTVFKVLRTLEKRGLIVRDKTAGCCNRYRFPPLRKPGVSIETSLPGFEGLELPLGNRHRPSFEGRGVVGAKGLEGYPVNGDPKKDSQEKAEGAAAPGGALAGGGVILTFACRGKPNRWQLSQTFLDELRRLFPTVDVQRECDLARVKIERGAVSMKTARGMNRFLLGWMGRANDRIRTPQAAGKIYRASFA